jgi:hypothetical protein
MPDSPESVRLTGRLQIGAGILISLLGIAGISLLILGYLPGDRDATPFPIVALIVGLGVVGMGWSNIRESRTLARERDLRTDARQGGGARVGRVKRPPRAGPE